LDLKSETVINGESSENGNDGNFMRCPLALDRSEVTAYFSVYYYTKCVLFKATASVQY